MTEGECNEALQRLYGFLDGELDQDLRDAIGAHLDDCAPCLEAYDFESELRSVIAACCTERVPDALRARVADLLAAPPPGLPGD